MIIIKKEMVSGEDDHIIDYSHHAHDKIIHTYIHGMLTNVSIVIYATEDEWMLWAQEGGFRFPPNRVTWSPPPFFPAKTSHLSVLLRSRRRHVSEK